MSRGLTYWPGFAGENGAGLRQDIEETQKDENGSQFADFLKQQAV